MISFSKTSAFMASNFKLFWVFLIFLINKPHLSLTQELYFNGFKHAGNNITLNGIAKILGNGVLQLTNDTPRLLGHAFYPPPIRVKSSKNARKAFSFSTNFAFAIKPQFKTLGGHGFAFTLAPSKDLPGALPSQYLGLLNSSDNGNLTNHIFAVEFDEVQDFEFKDINDNHVGININSMFSNASVPAAYYVDGNSTAQNLSMKTGETILCWIDYDAENHLLNVSLSLFSSKKPNRSLLSHHVDLSQYLDEFMYVGFSGSTGLLASSHYILGWSFKVNGQARPLDLSSLPGLPRAKKTNFGLILGVSIGSVIAFFVVVGLVVYLVWLYKNRDVIESWELDVGPHRFPYQELKKATKGFKDKQLVGFGGFGRVYKGTLPSSNTQVAVKRISHESRQGLPEFVAEIASIGRLRHRNLVQLIGWCRRKGDLILVYDYMPNGSLDKYLFDQPKEILSWGQRFNIIKGVASGLLYLHEGWEQTVVHRDVKAGNVLLDADFNGRLGDFGLAKLYEHGTDPSTTRVVGTLGYLAPELTRTGKPTTSSDVFAFGALLLEIGCGRRPIEPKASPEELFLVDWVWDRWKEGVILDVMDPKLNGDYNEIEAAIVLKLGLMCAAEAPDSRPSMKQLVRYLDGEAALPEEIVLPGGYSGKRRSQSSQRNGTGELFEDFVHSYPNASYMDMEVGSVSLLSLSGGDEGR